MQLPDKQHSVGNARDLSTVLNPKASCHSYFFFLEAVWCLYNDFFFPLSCAVSWVKEKYFTCCVSGVEYEVYCVIFHYFSFPLTFLVMLSHRKVTRFHSCEGLWHLWDETSRTGISLSYSYISGTGLDTQLWKECEYCSLTGTVAQKRQSHRNSGIITQQRSAGSWTSVFSAAWILSVQFCVL